MELPIYLIGGLTALIISLINYLIYTVQSNKDEKLKFNVSSTIRESVIGASASILAIVATKHLAPYIGDSNITPSVLLDTPKFE